MKFINLGFLILCMSLLTSACMNSESDWTHDKAIDLVKSRILTLNDGKNLNATEETIEIVNRAQWNAQFESNLNRWRVTFSCVLRIEDTDLSVADFSDLLRQRSDLRTGPFGALWYVYETKQAIDGPKKYVPDILPTLLPYCHS